MRCMRGFLDPSDRKLIKTGVQEASAGVQHTAVNNNDNLGLKTNDKRYVGTC